MAVLAGFLTGIETAGPFPAFDRSRIAEAPRDGADVNVTEVDVPAVVAFWITASGQDWHGAIEARQRLSGNALRIGSGSVAATRDGRSPPTPPPHLPLRHGNLVLLGA